jgi:hypothetical protein
VLAYFLAFMERGVPAASVVGFGDKKDMPITIGRWRDVWRTQTWHIARRVKPQWDGWVGAWC